MSHTKRPIIGVTASRYTRQNRSMLCGIGESYLQAVEAAGGIPLLIQPSASEATRAALYECCDGLLFSGGEDVSPTFYGATKHPAVDSIERLRDVTELYLARRAAAEGMPVLGICRGIQLLNVAMGGTLYQDLPSEKPSEINHYGSRAGGPNRGLQVHTMALEADSWLAEQFGATEVSVNSFHHQAICHLAPGLRVTGVAPDGVVEAVEATGSSFLVAVQCHPEEMWNRSDSRWGQVFQSFVAMVAGRAVAV